MEISVEYLRRVLPPEDPTPGRVPSAVRREIGTWIERLPDAGDDAVLFARSVRWTYAIFSELSDGQFRFDYDDRRWRWLWFPLPDLRRAVSIGVYDPNGGDDGFGLIASVPGWPGPDYVVVGYVRFPRLKKVFPLAVRGAEVEQHSAPHLAEATTSCWARCQLTGIWGVLTAGHAVDGNRPGASVPLAAGATGSLIRSHYQPVDAAFVYAGPTPSSPEPLPILRFAAAGLPASVETKRGPQPRKVVDVMNSIGEVRTREFCVLVGLDNPCEDGDSGSLVRLASGEAIGIYKARMNNMGLAQNFEQAVLALDVDAYV